jgi:hypothetical protein
LAFNSQSSPSGMTPCPVGAGRSDNPVSCLFLPLKLILKTFPPGAAFQMQINKNEKPNSDC